MKRMLLLAASFVLIASAAHAQYVPPGMPGYGGQSAMPYLNLLQPNINPTLTYAGIVQPQLQAQSMFQQMQSQINMTRGVAGGVAPPRNSGVADTGYAPARFMQYQQYFNTTFNTRRPLNQRQPGSNLGFSGGR